MPYQSLIHHFFGPAATIQETASMEKGASSRRYVRLLLEGTDKEGNQLPPSVVVMVLPDEPLKSDEVTSVRADQELPFINIQQAMSQARLPVPQIFYADVAGGLLLIEDLGETTLNRQVSQVSQSMRQSWYQAATTLLATMHQKMWPVPNGCLAGHHQFDEPLLRWELDHFREWGCEALDGELPPTRRAQLDQLFDGLAKQIDQLPKGFVHRDYQSRNLMVTGPTPSPDHLGIIDFQDALIGPRIYDMVALLNDSYVDLSFDTKTSLLQHYARERNLPFEELLQEFLLVTVQRKLKDAGRFVFIDRVKKDPSFLPFVEKSLSRVKEALARLDGHDQLKSVLSRIKPAELTC